MAKSLETARNKEQHLASLDDDAFMQEWQEVSDRAARDRELLVAYNAENQRRSRMQQLQRAMDLKPDDLDLLQRMQSDGIASEEAVGSDH